MPTTILETERLLLRIMSADDAAFYLRLVNEPAWLRFIGDKGLRTLDDARRAIQDGPVAMFARLGFSHYVVQTRSEGVAIGMCGLIKRAMLDDVDIGYAVFPGYVGNGYAFEAASAVMRYARDTLGLQRIVAIVSPDNRRSINLLEKLGLTFERSLTAQESDKPTELFAANNF